MLEFLCYLASQTLRGSFYIVFMLTLQRLLRDRLSPRVRAALWAPLLIALLAPEVCVVRVPVSQPVETTVVDALEQTRVALTSDVVKSAPEFGLRGVDARDFVSVFPSSLETGPFKKVAPPFETSSYESAWQAPDDAREAETNTEVAPTLADVDADVFSEGVDGAPLVETTSTPEPTEPSARTFENFFEQPLEETPEIAALGATPETADEAASAPLEETPEVADASAPLAVPTQAPQNVDARSGWFEFFEVAAIVSVAIWALGLVVAGVYLARSARVCRRWVRLSAPVDDADVLALYRRCADSLEIAAPPRLATTTDLSSPALLGWRRPVVLVPSEYVDDLSEERLKHVLLHELGHFKRGDAATGFLAFVVLATHWFNPLFWLAARSFHATREEACDAIALGSPALTNPNSAAEYARTLCEIAGRRPFVEQAFGAVGFSPTFRSLRRRVETLGRFGTWGRRAAIVCLVASLGAASFATVRLRPDVEPNDALANDEETDLPTSDEETDVPTSDQETDVPTSDEETSVGRQRARRLFATLPALPESPVPPTVAPNDPIAAVDVETLYQDEADRLFFGHSTKERQTFVADAVAKLRSAQTQGEAEYYAALGDYLIRESAFFWLVAGVDATVRDDAVAASAELPALAESETPADYPKSVSSTELDAALARAEKTADPNFRFLAKLHRALADDAKRDQPGRYRADYAEPLSAYVHSPFWREQLKPRPCRGLLRELEAGAYFLAEAAAQGNGDAAASLARYIENGAVPGFAPSGFVAEVGSRAGIAEDDLKSTTADERPATVAFLYALAGAEAGSPRAQALVASYYARGFGVERNVAEALRWGRLFYEADVASGKAVCIPPLRYYSPKKSKQPDRLVPKTLDELHVAETSVLRRLEPLVDVLTTPSPFAPALDVSTTSSDSDADKPKVPLAHRVFLEGGACSAGSRANADPKTWATCLLLAEAALDLEPTPENVKLAELFLRRANAFESRSFFERSSDEAFPNEIRVALNAERLCVTPGIVEANERLANIFENNYLDVNDLKKAGEFRLYAKSFDRPNAGAPSLGVIWIESPKIDVLTLPPSAFAPTPPQAPALSGESADDAKPSFVAPRTPEFEATIAPIFAKLEKTLVDAKNGNADALTARFNEYFDDATDLYPNGRSGSPEVARYKVERLTQEIERLEQTDADAATLERLRKSRDSWRRLADASRLADETPVAATNA